MILYLDYDGVLNEAICHDSYDLLKWSPLLIEVLMPFPSVEIVLSTSWVRNRGFDRTLAYLPKELQRRVVGATYDPALRLTCQYDSATRLEQITQHAERNNITRWIAIDDLYEGSELWDDALQDRLILTDPIRGLCDPAVHARLKMLLQEFQ